MPPTTIRRSGECSTPTVASRPRSSPLSSQDERLEAIVSVHQLGAPRRWTPDEVAAATAAAERVAGAPVRIGPADGWHNRWHPDLAPAASVEPGDVLTVETRDGLDGQLTRESTHADCAAPDLGLAHPLTGPVHVAGAEPGDVLEVQFVALRDA